MKHYDWDATFSRQTGSQGEFCIVSGGKGIGKTFGLRLKCIQDYIKNGHRFVEICRTKEERSEVEAGYFSKIQHDGFYTEYDFKVEKHIGYIAKRVREDEKPEWDVLMYFAALTAFQVEKRRTFTGMRRFIFDEAAIDRKDRYHRYLPNEFFILANLLDSMSREQPNDTPFYKVYLLMNSCDLTCPYLQNLGVNYVPEYGYHWFNDKHVLFHYVEPWDAEDRKANTLVGRMLAGTEESKMIFDNVFDTGYTKDIKRKPKTAKFAYALVFNSMKYGIWIDYEKAYFYVTDLIPKEGKPVFVLTKRDNTIDYQAVKRSGEQMTLLKDVYYKGGLRYSSPGLKESFLKLLEFLGVH